MHQVSEENAFNLEKIRTVSRCLGKSGWLEESGPPKMRKVWWIGKGVFLAEFGGSWWLWRCRLGHSSGIRGIADFQLFLIRGKALQYLGYEQLCLLSFESQIRGTLINHYAMRIVSNHHCCWLSSLVLAGSELLWLPGKEEMLCLTEAILNHLHLAANSKSPASAWSQHSDGNS